MVADCTSDSLTLTAQRKNARLCAAAPDLMQLLEDAYLTLEPEYRARYLELAKYVD
jgi:hypothetical protein